MLGMDLPPDPYDADLYSPLFVVFRPVAGWPGYGVDSDGNIWGCRLGPGKFTASWHKLRPGCTPSGHFHVNLHRGDARRPTTFRVHQLVLMAFLGLPPAGCEVLHINGRPYDNRLANLLYGTRTENLADQRRHGVLARGSRKATAKFDESDIPGIRRMLAEGVSRNEVARRRGVHHSTIDAIAKGKAWVHVISN